MWEILIRMNKALTYEEQELGVGGQDTWHS